MQEYTKQVTVVSSVRLFSNHNHKISGDTVDISFQVLRVFAGSGSKCQPTFSVIKMLSLIITASRRIVQVDLHFAINQFSLTVKVFMFIVSILALHSLSWCFMFPKYSFS